MVLHNADYLFISESEEGELSILPPSPAAIPCALFPPGCFPAMTGSGLRRSAGYGADGQYPPANRPDFPFLLAFGLALLGTAISLLLYGKLLPFCFCSIVNGLNEAPLETLRKTMQKPKSLLR